ncbi:Alb1-domain-containing protein [Chaetomium fimeti]|uniref:Alb1-domain-containing protein n=1 Tax=Chaetomium fimeti TaxID=1854472 RepID=A0AAE0HKZ2_9PEZI|nr:Alb1-domain-containing protein [Chaetomium fimeti]
MAKGSIAKGKRGPSIHSRAARRATSPGIDTDKSLKEVRAPQESIDRRPAVLAAHHAGGVSKKAKSGRRSVLSTRARRRQERSMDRAEAVMDRTAVKVQKSKGHARVIHGRRKTWDEVNREAFEREELRKLGKKAKAKMEEDAAVEAFYADDGDAEMEGAEDDGEGSAGETGAVAVPTAPEPVDVAEEDIL